MKNRGVSVLELLVVIAIIAIIAGAIFPKIEEYYRIYKFNDYAFSIESLVKWAKLKALEQSVNIGVCVQDRAIKVINMGTSRSGVCTGDLLKEINISDDFINLQGGGAFGESGVAFDPRGFAIFGGYICISDGEKFFKLCIRNERGMIRVEKGAGICQPCS